MPSDDWLEAAQTARRLQRSDHHRDGRINTRATHRADPTDTSLPPLYACREADLLSSLEAGRAGEPHTLSVLDARTGWRAWRAWP